MKQITCDYPEELLENLSFLVSTTGIRRGDLLRLALTEFIRKHQKASAGTTLATRTELGYLGGGLLPPPEEKRTKARSKPQSFDPKSVPLPRCLDTPEFREVWEDRITERLEMAVVDKKHTLTSTQLPKQLKKLAKLCEASGIGACITAVEKATEFHWVGIVFDTPQPQHSPGLFDRQPTPPSPPSEPEPKYGVKLNMYRQHRPELQQVNGSPLAWYCQSKRGFAVPEFAWDPELDGPWPITPTAWCADWGPFPPPELAEIAAEEVH